MIEANIQTLAWARLFYAAVYVVTNGILCILLTQTISAIAGYGRWSDIPIALMLLWMFVTVRRTRVLLQATFGVLLTIDWEIAQQAIRSEHLKRSREWANAQEWRVAHGYTTTVDIDKSV